VVAGGGDEVGLVEVGVVVLVLVVSGRDEVVDVTIVLDVVDDEDFVATELELSACCRRSTSRLACNSTGSAATTHNSSVKNRTTDNSRLLIAEAT
jgi:hypothetical protein